MWGRRPPPLQIGRDSTLNVNAVVADSLFCRRGGARFRRVAAQAAVVHTHCRAAPGSLFDSAVCAPVASTLSALWPSRNLGLGRKRASLGHCFQSCLDLVRPIRHLLTVPGAAKRPAAVVSGRAGPKRRLSPVRSPDHDVDGPWGKCWPASSRGTRRRAGIDASMGHHHVSGVQSATQKRTRTLRGSGRRDGARETRRPPCIFILRRQA